MSSSHKSGLSSQVHLDIEDHMWTCNILETNILAFIRSRLFRCRSILIFECNHYLFHFLLDGLPPEIRPCFLINQQGFLNQVRQSDAIFVAGLTVLPLYFPNYSIPSTKCLWHPPLERWLFLDSIRNGIFSDFNGVRVLQVLQLNPFGRSILSLTQKLPAFGCCLGSSRASFSCFLVSVGNMDCPPVLLMISNLLQYCMHLSLIVTLGENILDNNVGVVSI